MIESHLTFLEEEIIKKEQSISDKESQLEFMKMSINTDKELVKVLKKGLEKMKDKTPKP